MTTVLRVIMEISLHFLSGLFIRRENRIVFGAWKGERYADNSKYMFEYLKNKDQYELIWCGRKHLRDEVPKGDNIKFVKYGTWEANYYAITAKYVFVTHDRGDITKYNIFNGARVVQLWHGVGIKGLNMSRLLNMNVFEKFKHKYRTVIRKYDYFICSSEKNKKRNLKASNVFYGINPNNIIRSGQPRNDLFFSDQEGHLQRIRKSYYEKYGIPINKRIISYIPTYRKNKDKRFLFSQLPGDISKNLGRILENQNAILIEKVHYEDKNINMIKNTDSNSVYNVSCYSDIDIQELLLISDMLITDYSSCYMDYTLLNRPVIHFIYDYKEYINNDQGLYYPFGSVSAGKIATETKELLKCINLGLLNPEDGFNLRDRIRKTMMEYECGRSCETIFNTLTRGRFLC